MPVLRKPSRHPLTEDSSGSRPTFSSTARPSSRLTRWQKPVFIVFLTLFLINEALLLLRIQPRGTGQWIEALFLLAAAASALLSLAQRLPLQNVFMAALLISLVAGGIFSIGALTGVPFGPILYTESFGPALFGVLPWPVPLLWIAFVIQGRGVARLIMRPWRQTNYYGYWVIVLTCLLVMLWAMALEPFAVVEKQYWRWQPTRTSWLWYSAPWVNFLGWFSTCLAVVCLTLPWLINKQPVKRPVDYHPLAAWFLIHAWLFTGNALNHLWTACILSLIAIVPTALLAVRGARRCLLINRETSSD
jgi:uncharacterized membrane protein